MYVALIMRAVVVAVMIITTIMTILKSVKADHLAGNGETGTGTSIMTYSLFLVTVQES